MGDKIRVEQAVPEDAETLADISKRAFDSDVEVGAPGEGGPDGYDSIEAHRRDTETTRLEYLKVLYDDKVVGGMRIYKMGEGHYEIFGVFVDPDYHRKGIGKRSFELVLERYPDAKKWTLDTPDWNIRTKNFYEKLGFVQYGVMRWVPTFELRAFELVLDETQESRIIAIEDLKEDMERIDVEGVIEQKPEPREVQSKKDGKTHRVCDILLKDETGSVKFVLWNHSIRQVQIGEKIRVENAFVNSFNDELQLNVSPYGRIIILSK
jgi:GNAT superfamily N-acetyltransferase